MAFSQKFGPVKISRYTVPVFNISIGCSCDSNQLIGIAKNLAFLDSSISILEQLYDTSDETTSIFLPFHSTPECRGSITPSSMTSELGQSSSPPLPGAKIYRW